MEFFEVATAQRAMRRLKPDPIPEAALRQIMDAAICATSGGNLQGWSFVLVRDAAKRKRLGELYCEAWAELMNVPYYAGAGPGIARQPNREDARLRPAPGGTHW
jgi:nitroreductase